jgi:hypothetical protein
LPLWQIGLTVTVSSGMLFWKEVSSRGEFLYLHARSGDLLLAQRDGIRFVSSVDAEPSAIRDLDDVCTFELKTPDEIELKRAVLRRLLSRDEAITQAQRKYPIQVDSCRLVFLPYWRFETTDAVVAIDGVLGKPLSEEALR